MGKRGHIIHFSATRHPIAEWTGQQLREAFPFDQLPRYLQNRDAIFDHDFREQVRDVRIEEVLSTPRSPWQRGCVERVIGSTRLACLDQVIVFSPAECLLPTSTINTDHERTFR